MISQRNDNANKVYEEIKTKLKDKTFSQIEIEEFAPNEKWAYKIAKDLGEKMKVTQLRKVFTAIKQIELKTKVKKDDDQINNSEIYMLIPHLAYAKARKLIKEEFYVLMKLIIGDNLSTKIKNVADYRRFVEFMTAIVAYHKQFSK